MEATTALLVIAAGFLTGFGLEYCYYIICNCAGGGRYDELKEEAIESAGLFFSMHDLAKDLEGWKVLSNADYLLRNASGFGASYLCFLGLLTGEFF